MDLMLSLINSEMFSGATSDAQDWPADILPPFPVDDSIDRHPVDTVLAGKIAGTHAFGKGIPDLHDLDACEFGMSILFACGPDTMLPAVGIVGCPGIPSQIRDVVVEMIPVIMAPFHSVGTWADEGQKYQMMDTYLKGHVGLVSDGDVEPTGMAWMWGKCAREPWVNSWMRALSPVRDHAALITDFISWESGDRFPLF